MNILLLGAEGQLGGYLQRSLARIGKVRASSRHAFDESLRIDLKDTAGLLSLLARESPDLVVNAAAYTAVDQAESNSEEAMLTNAALPAVIASVITSWNGALIHFSTDYVFDGMGTRPYLEDDPTGPLGVYGESKLNGEIALSRMSADHLVLRTAWVYSLLGRNFLTTMLRLGTERDSLTVVDDQHGTPTSAGFLAEATAQIAEKWMTERRSRRERSGIYHLTASGETTWHGFAQAIFEEAVHAGRLNAAPSVLPTDTAGFPTPAKRPAWSVLNTNKVQTVFGVTPPDWRDELHTVMSGAYDAGSST